VLVEDGRRQPADRVAREIDGLLEETVDHCKARERAAFDVVSGGDQSPIVLLGAGQLGRRTVAALERVDRPPIAVADNNPALWGTTIGTVPICSPAEAAQRYGESATFVVSIWRAGGTHRYEHSRRQLHELGCRRVTSIAPLAWKYAEVMLPHYTLDLPHRVLEQADSIRSAFALFTDDRSRAEFIAQLRFRLLADFDGLAHPDSDPQYLAPDLFVESDQERVVDAGAFNGDSLRAFLSTGRPFASYVALEPDPANFAALSDYLTSLPTAIGQRVVPLPVAAFSRRVRMRIEGTGSAAAALVEATGAPRDDDVECVTLDELLADRGVSFLKLDIEGAEPEALKGGASLIARDRPVIAVCVYHLQDHLWRLPSLIRSLVDDYRYHLRPYNEEGWDLVCYAVPRERSKLQAIRSHD